MSAWAFALLTRSDKLVTNKSITIPSPKRKISRAPRRTHRWCRLIRHPFDPVSPAYTLFDPLGTMWECKKTQCKSVGVCCAFVNTLCSCKCLCEGWGGGGGHQVSFSLVLDPQTLLLRFGGVCCSKILGVDVSVYRVAPPCHH